MHDEDRPRRGSIHVPRWAAALAILLGLCLAVAPVAADAVASHHKHKPAPRRRCTTKRGKHGKRVRRCTTARKKPTTTTTTTTTTAATTTTTTTTTTTSTTTAMTPATSPFVGSAHLMITSTTPAGAPTAGSILKGTFTSTVSAFGRSYSGGAVSIKIESSTPQSDGSLINDETLLLTFSDPGAGRVCLSVAEHWTDNTFSSSTGTWNTTGADGGTLANSSETATFSNAHQPDGSYVITVNGTATQLLSPQPLSAECLSLA